jgi:hypothetical protein
MVAVRVAALAALAGQSDALQHSANPIRRVVTLIQNIQAKVQAEGAKEKELFEKFMCYCQTGAQDLEKAISDNDNKLPIVEGNLKEKIAQKNQLQAEIKGHKQDTEDCLQAIAEANALREKENKEFLKQDQRLTDYVKTLKIGIGMIHSGSFLQGTVKSTIKDLAIDSDISPADRDQVMSLIEAGSGEEPEVAVSHQNPAIGILSKMSDKFAENQVVLRKEEDDAIANKDALVASKKEQMQANKESVEAKLERVSNIVVEISQTEEDLADTQETQAEDKKFLAELEKSCATKQKEWDVRCKTRSDELLALADTINILNDDDALELFKKTLPASSFLQEKVTGEETRKQALAALKNVHNDYRLDLVALSLKGKKVSFDKVVTMIDKMVGLLNEEQSADDEKKAMCNKQLDKAEDDLKTTEGHMKDLEETIADTKEKIATLTSEIEALSKGIKDLDEQVKESTEIRKEEHEDYQSLMAGDAAAKEIIGMAKNRLQKFYNPSMYKAPPKRELSEAERIEQNMGYSFMQLKSSAAPPPPPETFGAYTKKGEETNGVMTMMDMIIADLDKEMQEAEVEETDAQQEYEQFTKDAAEKRILDSKSLQQKESAKADSGAALLEYQQEHTDKMKEAMAIVDVLKNLHQDCDWLLQNFDVRKQARTDEIDALKKAKAVLSGADFSLMQQTRRLRRVRSHE